MSHSTQKSKSKSKTTQFDLTDLELELADINFEIVGQQLNAIYAQSDFQQAAFSTLGPAFKSILQDMNVEASIFTGEEQADRLRAQYERGDMQSEAGDQLLEQQLARIRSGGDVPGWDGSTDLSDEQRSPINQNAASQLAIGESNISRYGQNALEMIREELAPSRGLRSSDTPIQDRGFRVGEEMVRQQGNLANTIGAQSAQQMLQYPLQNAQTQMQGDQLFNQNSQFQQQLMQAAGNFNQGLQQQAFQNKLALTGQVGNQGLGLIGGAQPASNLQQALKPQLGTSTKSSGESESRTTL